MTDRTEHKPHSSAELADVVRAGAHFYMAHRMTEYPHPNAPEITMAQHVPKDENCPGCQAEAALQSLVEQLEAAREALREVPYAITMALQWTVVPSDVPKQMHEPLRLHREMLTNVHDAARTALDGSNPASSPRERVEVAKDRLRELGKSYPDVPDPASTPADGKTESFYQGSASSPASKPDVSERGHRPRTADHLAVGRQWNSPLGPGIPRSETSDPARSPQ